MVKFVPSLDGVGTSLSYPAKTSHRALTSDEMAMVNMDLQNRGMKNSRIAKKNTDSAGNTLRSLLLRFCKMFMGLIVFSLGITLCIIAGLGQTTSTGTSTALSEALHIRVGTAMELIYALFLLLQLILLGKKFHPTALLQMIPVFLNGALLNFFRYDFVPFQRLSPHTYPERLLFFAAGMPLISLGFTMVKRAGFLNFPPESFCTIVSEKTGIRFGTVKIILDFIYFLSTLLICLLNGIRPDMIREGTLAFAIGNGLLINFFGKPVQAVFNRIR